MAGGDKSTQDLIKGTKKGVLVTRTWYIRMVDPQTVLLTGLTRDGTFYIENGEIKYPIKNFRFNESPAIMLNNIEELGKPVRVADDESPFVMMIPPMKIRDFTFTRCRTRSDELIQPLSRCGEGGVRAGESCTRSPEDALRSTLIRPFGHLLRGRRERP